MKQRKYFWTLFNWGLELKWVRKYNKLTDSSMSDMKTDKP
jgi:hypothetical protein